MKRKGAVPVVVPVIAIAVVAATFLLTGGGKNIPKIPTLGQIQLPFGIGVGRTTTTTTTLPTTTTIPWWWLLPPWMQPTTTTTLPGTTTTTLPGATTTTTTPTQYRCCVGRQSTCRKDRCWTGEMPMGTFSSLADCQANCGFGITTTTILTTTTTVPLIPTCESAWPKPFSQKSCSVRPGCQRWQECKYFYDIRIGAHCECVSKFDTSTTTTTTPTTTTTTIPVNCQNWCQGSGYQYGYDFASTGYDCHGHATAQCFYYPTRSMDNGICCCWDCYTPPTTTTTTIPPDPCYDTCSSYDYWDTMQSVGYNCNLFADQWCPGSFHTYDDGQCCCWECT